MSFHTRKFIAEIEYGRLIQISPDKLPCRKTVVSLIRGGELTPWAGTPNFAAGRLANEVQGGQPDGMTTPVCPSYAGYRFPAEVISHAVRLYFRFPLNSRMVEEILVARDTTRFLIGARCLWGQRNVLLTVRALAKVAAGAVRMG